MKIIALTRLVQNQQHPPFHCEKTNFPKITVFLKIQMHLHFSSKVPQSKAFLFTVFWTKPSVSQRFQHFRTLSFYLYLFNSQSNMHVNMDYPISLHPKKGHFTYFSGKTQHFLGNKINYTTGKLGPLRLFYPKNEGLSYKKRLFMIFSTQWPPNFHSFLQGLLTTFPPCCHFLFLFAP